MSLSNLIRWGALSAVAGGVLFAALFAADLLVESRVLEGAFFESHWGYHSLDAPVSALLAAGVLGLYLWQREDFGKLGKTGFYLAFGGFALAAIGGLGIIVVELAVAEAATPGWLDGVTHVLAVLLSIVGLAAFGAATFRTKVLPRGGALLLVTGPVLFLGMLFGGVEGWLLMVPAILVGGAFAWLGYALYSRASASAGQVARAGA